jgi:hypothetical protein
MTYFIILGLFTLVGMVVSARLKSKFNQYARIANSSGMNGAEVAQSMLNHYGISDVRIGMGQGTLSDHYNPQEKVIMLSPDVYQGRSIAAAAVAAHECGHAVQHKEKYPALQFRSNMVPILQFSSRMQQFLFMGVIFGMGAGMGGSLLMGIMTATFGITALFSLITLPVEFDASNRALAWLDNTGVTRGMEYEGAKDALWWAAMTYVVQALSALVMFLYFLLSFLNRD